MCWEWQDGRMEEGSEGGRREKEEAGLEGHRTVLKQAQQGWGERGREDGGEEGRGAQTEKGGIKIRRDR